MAEAIDPKKKIQKNMTGKKALQFLLLGLLWLLLCIPVITAGAATCSVFYVGIKILNDEADGNIFKLFFKGIKQNFVQGLLMALVSAVSLGGFGALIVWSIISDQSRFVILIAVGCTFAAFLYNSFVYPIIGRYENTFSNALKNAVALSFTYLKDAVVLSLILLLEIAIEVWLFRLNLFAGCVSLLFWPSLIFYTSAFRFAVIFYKVENPVKYDDENETETDSEAEIDTEADAETESASE